MRKLIESTFVTLNGVVVDPQNWSPPYWDDEDHNRYSHDLIFAADALLLGRSTYDVFAEAWPSRAGTDDPYVDRINALPKYVASRTLTEAGWNASVIKGDVAEAVAELKRQPGENILKYGTGELDLTLIEHNLVDEFHFWMFPVIAGGGGHMPLESLHVSHLELLDQKTFKTGIVVLVYGPK
ncbi:MAG: hypothetical protein HOQ24_15150 [Mycobacteriaceae bacterium]|nr:hypothetical protein [Mycobacteriaceae bacterium]